MLFLWSESEPSILYKLSCMVYLFQISWKKPIRVVYSFMGSWVEQDRVWALGLPGCCTELEQLSVTFLGSRRNAIKTRKPD